MTFALQSMSDARTLQSATAPVLLGAVGASRFRTPAGQTGANVTGVRDQNCKIQFEPQTINTHSARDSGLGTLRGFQPHGFRPPGWAVLPEGTNRATVGTSRGSGVLCNVTLSRMGLGSIFQRVSYQATTTGLRHRQMPYRGGNPHFRNLIQNQSLTLSKAQANYALFPLPSRCRRRNEGDSLRIAQSTTVHVLRKDRLQCRASMKTI